MNHLFRYFEHCVKKQSRHDCFDFIKKFYSKRRSPIWIFSQRFSKKNADYSSDFFLRPTKWQIL